MSPKRKVGSPKAKRKKNRASTAPEAGNRVPKQRKVELFGFMAERMKIVEDIVSPLPDWKHWRPAECLKK